MHTITFYPVGNGDTSQIVLANGKRILFDFRHLTASEAGDTPEINLKERLRKELKDVGRDYFDVVAFTHGDDDHIANSTEFFELTHADKYKGGDRIKIRELWVPAAMVLETAENHQQQAEFVIWRQEARHRLREKRGIRIFSRPDKLKAWMEKNDLDFEERRHLITDAGQLANGFSLAADGVEFFCHSPFVKHVDGGDVARNEASLIFNVRFNVSNRVWDFLAVGDTEAEVLAEIVSITKAHGREDRLKWDLFNVPHHCSYLALSQDKGEKETIPIPLVKELLLLGKEGARIISSSLPIDDEPASYTQVQPPHIQAKKAYDRHLKDVKGGRIHVTMEHKGRKKPEPITFKVDAEGITLTGEIISGAAAIITTPAPRAGNE
ncbi:hypothetical protein [Geothrix oryzisoli]|uniref:hypothetical protein n=1 Tax=Geothrix oryzisoli TaxID=2922721 RepID=UPI001FADB4ED|nr:hypothetical protein [Geothrix oryzisoli]